MLELLLHPLEHCAPLPGFKPRLLPLIKPLVFILNTTECYCYAIFIASPPKSSELPKLCKNSSYVSRTEQSSFQLWERVGSLTLSFLGLTSLILAQHICSKAFLWAVGNKGVSVSVAPAHKTNLSLSSHAKTPSELCSSCLDAADWWSRHMSFRWLSLSPVCPGSLRGAELVFQSGSIGAEKIVSKLPSSHKLSLAGALRDLAAQKGSPGPS